MENMEMEPRVRPLGFKVKAVSRESSSAQKAAHVLEADLRTHWSTATNTKEWILLELDEACLLSHVRLYNKSVLEWEITAGLRYKPETFVKIRPRCEAPKRDVMYPMNYTPCRYVRISCLRGNPIALFFIQLFGVFVPGLEPEFQPVVNYLLPHIISHKQDAHDMHLQLLQDMTCRLLVCLPHLETDLTNFADAAESNIRFFAMLAGPFYPILHIANEREAAKTLPGISDADAFKNNQTLPLTVSSNFEVQPRRSRSPSPYAQPISSSIAFRPDVVVMLLRQAYKDPHLGHVCRLASRALHKLNDPIPSTKASGSTGDLFPLAISDEIPKAEALNHMLLADYSSLFGEDYKITDDHWDDSYLNVIDLAAVEEGILHVLYACASQPLLCCKLADINSDFWSTLPLIQALLPALRPPVGSPPDQINDNFWPWQHSSVQRALSQIVAMSSSSMYNPLLRACAGYLSSFSSTHAKAACVLIDLCSGPLSPWLSTVTLKVDLAIELLEDLLGVVQGACQSLTRARAALKYIILALSGHMDDILAKYKEVKHKLLFLLEMLEPFLDPVITVMRNTIAFGDVSTMFSEKQERTCVIALNVIRTAVGRHAVLPYLESEWRHGSVAPSVLLSILGPHMPLPPEIDLCKCSVSNANERESSPISYGSSNNRHGASSKSSSPDESEGKVDASEATIKMDVYEEVNHLFAPPEVKRTVLASLSNHFTVKNADKSSTESSMGSIEKITSNHSQIFLILDNDFSVEYFNLQADYLQLVNHQDCEYRASEFQRLATDLCSQNEITPEGHDAAIDALLLAAECYVNPFFMTSFRSTSKLTDQMRTIKSNMASKHSFMDLKRDFQKASSSLEVTAYLETKRDKTVLHILLQAAKLDRDYQKNATQGDPYPYDPVEDEQGLEIPQVDIQSADAVTLLRQNQFLLCHFLMKQLKREQHSSHEILFHSLLFLLQSATELYCDPENVINVILQSAENFNQVLASLHFQLKEGNMLTDLEKLHGLKRRWVLLKMLVLASSGSHEGADFATNTRNGFQYRSLVPPVSWMQQIYRFSNCPFPLVRFLGWMAVSRYAKHYLKERLFLASDLAQLTLLLSIFTDELAMINSIVDQNSEIPKSEESEAKQVLKVDKEIGRSDQLDVQESFSVLHPDLHKFFPNLKSQFGKFGEIILEAVGLQLKCLSSSSIPDLLCWFSDLCLSPCPEGEKNNLPGKDATGCLKGYSATNARAVILYIFESMLAAHMKAMLPEMPRVAQIMISLCKASYCDVTFLDSVLCLLRPLISYFLRKVSDDEKLLIDVVSCQDFELSSFEELFASIRCRTQYQEGTAGPIQRSLVIFILGSIFPDLSFQRKSEILQSLFLWVDYTTSEPTSSFYNYLCAFQKVMESCDLFLVQNLKLSGINISVEANQLYEGSKLSSFDGSISSSFLTRVADQSCLAMPSKDLDIEHTPGNNSDPEVHLLSQEEIKEFSERLEMLISNLIPAIESSWKMHYQLAMKLTFTSAKCFLFSRCLSSTCHAVGSNGEVDGENICPFDSTDVENRYWENALEGLMEVILATARNHCWQVASAMFNYLLMLPQNFYLDCVVSGICYAIKHFCCHAPKLSWRLQSDKWLSSLFVNGIKNIDGSEDSLVDLFCTMLGHCEPEQRSIALQFLQRIVGLNTCEGASKLSTVISQDLVVSDSVIRVPESTISLLVSSTWDRVTSLVLSDPSLLLRAHAMALLSGYVPFAMRTQLQSFLVASDTILFCGTRLSYSMEESQLTRLSLGVLANACLHSPDEDIALIPEKVWKKLEDMGLSRNGGLDVMEKDVCLALCKLRMDSNVGKEVLKEALLSDSVVKDIDPDFKSTRESILQVFSSLTTVQSYFDFFSKRIDQESQELVEAEIEMDLLQKERALQEVSTSNEELHPSSQAYDKKENSRLEQIKDGIRSLEKSRIKEEVIARRQRKLLMMKARQKYLEEAASREMELLQELDRERASEVEREIERKRQVELERAKTRELQYKLDMERERQMQREIQLELEQVELGVRSSRKEFSSNPNSRMRERYREREHGRSGQEGSVRPSSRGGESPQATTSGPGANPPAPTVVLAGSRSFSGNLPTILQSRDRADERSTSYEDNFEGSRDSGDAGSVGDPELASAFEGMGVGFGSAARNMSRGNKLRQVVERRERDARREGKWERKHS